MTIKPIYSKVATHPGDAKLWIVYERKALERGNQKVRVFQYAVLAHTDEEAISKAKSEHGYRADTSSWSARDLDGAFSMGCYLDTATAADRRARGDMDHDD